MMIALKYTNWKSLL